MKHEAPTLGKFLLLQRRLKLPRWQVVGLLESLWLYAANHAPDGSLDPERMPELAAWSEVDDDKLPAIIDAMTATRWLDKTPAGWQIHDWLQHAPDFIRKRVQRRDAARNIQACLDKSGQVQTSLEMSCITQPNPTQPNKTEPNPTQPDSPPTPSNPKPEIQTTKTTTKAGEDSFDGTIPLRWGTDLLTRWNALTKGRKGGVNDARQLNDAIWEAHREESLTAEQRAKPYEFIVAQAEVYLRSDEATKEGGKYCASLRNFLFKRKFFESPEQWNHAPKANGDMDGVIEKMNREADRLEAERKHR